MKILLPAFISGISFGMLLTVLLILNFDSIHKLGIQAQKAITICESNLSRKKICVIIGIEKK